MPYTLACHHAQALGRHALGRIGVAERFDRFSWCWSKHYQSAWPYGHVCWVGCGLAQALWFICCWLIPWLLQAVATWWHCPCPSLVWKFMMRYIVVEWIQMVLTCGSILGMWLAKFKLSLWAWPTWLSWLADVTKGIIIKISENRVKYITQFLIKHMGGILNNRGKIRDKVITNINSII
jgi:hypothetical protein